MSRDKQLEEMANITCLCNACGICECDGEPCDLDCSEGKAMERLYNAGYRKASEVASEIFAEIETSLVIGGFVNGEKYIAIREEDYNHYKKKYTQGKEESEDTE